MLSWGQEGDKAEEQQVLFLSGGSQLLEQPLWTQDAASCSSLSPLYLGVGIREAAMIFMGYTCLAFTKYLKIVLLSDSIAELALGDGVLPCKQALTVLLNGYRLEHMLEDISVHFIQGLTHLSL